jgi:hypothetical protein
METAASFEVRNAPSSYPTEARGEIPRADSAVPVPFAAWHVLAWVAELLPGAPITRNQVELMAIDTVASTDVPGFADLGISPGAMEQILQSVVARD